MKQTCMNCKNIDLADAEDPKCGAGCIDFKKQLCSGVGTVCKKWEATD